MGQKGKLRFAIKMLEESKNQILQSGLLEKYDRIEELNKKQFISSLLDHQGFLKMFIV